MNKGFASGFISSDIKIENVSTKNGDMLKAKFSIALNRRSKDGGADFPWFTAFGKNADNINKYFSKGKGIYVEYHISTGKYTNKNGDTKYTEDKIIDRFEFPPVRKNEETTPVSGSDSYGNADNDTHTYNSDTDDSFMNVPDGIEADLPFR